MVRNNTIAVFIIIFICISLFNDYMIYKNNPAFHKQEMTGSVVDAQSAQAQLRILPGPGQCGFDLQPNFNLISICANATNMSVPYILDGLDYAFVLRYNSSSQGYEMYNPILVQQEFDQFEFNRSYFIYMNSGKLLFIRGNTLGDIDLALLPMYNLPGYTYTYTSNVSQYLSTMGDDYRFMLKFNPFTQQFIMYNRILLTQEFYTISTGEGQVIYVSDPAGTNMSYNTSKMFI
jgi:hypothetical protein